jgi:imidazolonepropionase-like amidohydrolase
MSSRDMKVLQDEVAWWPVVVNETTRPTRGLSRRAVALVAAAAVALMCAPALHAQASRGGDVLIRGARVHTVTSRGVLEKADVLVRGGRISAVGAGLAAPSGVTVVEANGRALTPGMWGGLSGLGLQEVEIEPTTNENALGDNMKVHEMQLRPEFDPTPQFNPRSVTVPIARVSGITWGVLAPANGGVFLTGQGSAVTLDGRFDATLAGSRSLFVDLSTGGMGNAGGARAAQFMLLDQAVREARSPGTASDNALLQPAGREALRRYLAGGRVVFAVDRAVDIRRAVEFARANGMKPVIAGGAEAWVVANELAAANVPVLLDPLVNLPADFDKIGARLDNAALLNRAGVRVGITSQDSPSHRPYRVRQIAGNAVAHGLPPDIALAALTATPADIFGLGATRGRIAQGQIADLALWSGDPLEVTSIADQVWIAGVAVAMTSRQTELRDRYLERLQRQQAR